jgi:hypothetical protein
MYEPLSTFLYNIFESYGRIGSILFNTGDNGIFAPASRLFESKASIFELPSTLAKHIDWTKPSKVIYPITLNLSSDFYDNINTFLL